MTNAITRREALASSAGLAGAAMLPSHAAAQAGPLTFAFGPKMPLYALGLIAEAKGFFKAEGINLQLVIGNAGTHGRQALAAGQALIAHGEASHALQLSSRGKPAKIILASQMVCSISNVVVRKDLHDAGITTVEALAAYRRSDGGKPIVAVTAIGAGGWMYGTYLFETKGLGDRINWVAGGGPNTLFPGLETKQFDAMICPRGWMTEAQTRGFGKAIYDTSEPGVFAQAFGGTLPVLVVYTLAETVERERAKVQAFVNAMVQAMRWTKATPLEELYNFIGLKEFAGIDKAAVNADLGFDQASWAYDGRIDKASFDRAGRVWFRKGTDIQPVTYETMVDMSFVEAAHARQK